MSAPAPSRLDANQCIQGSFDESTGRLRTDSLATVVNADVDVSLDASEDSVAIADPDGNFLDINPDGSINVTTIGFSLNTELYNFFNEVTGVSTGITTLIGTYTATNDKYLQKIEVSGTNIAEYEVTIDGVTQDKKRTYFGSSLNNIFDFNQGIKLIPGQVINVYVVHNRPVSGDFNSRIQILERT